MKIFFIAGEASGDLHGANLSKAILSLSPNAQLMGWGGDKMQDAGVKVTKHYKDLAFMGFIEVVMNLNTIMRNFERCKKEIASFQPDTVVMIDYPGFNLRMAEWCHEKNIRVVYYISPQIWAWKQGRIKQIKSFVDEMCVVLPFEKDFYKKLGMDVHFVGHPLLDEINTNREKQSRKKQIALLPGSRKQEILSMLPLMLEVAGSFKDYDIVIAGAPGQTVEFYRSIISDNSVRIAFGETYDILATSAAGLVTSGTATLEAGIFQMPQVVCYKGNPLSYFIARKLVKIKYISLVNLILDKPAVKELIQFDFNSHNLKSELKSILEDQERKEQIQKDYLALYNKLGGNGASMNTAKIVLKSSK